MITMNPARPMIVAIPPARTTFIALRLYLPVAVSVDVLLLLGCRLIRHVARIDTDGDHVKLFPHIELQLGQRAGDPFHDHAAEHRAAVVHEVEEHRLSAELIAQPDDLAALIAE